MNDFIKPEVVWIPYESRLAGGSSATTTTTLPTEKNTRHLLQEVIHGNKWFNPSIILNSKCEIFTGLYYLDRLVQEWAMKYNVAAWSTSTQLKEVRTAKVTVHHRIPKSFTGPRKHRQHNRSGPLLGCPLSLHAFFPRCGTSEWTHLSGWGQTERLLH